MSNKFLFFGFLFFVLGILKAQKKRSVSHFLTVSTVGTMDKIRDRGISSKAFQGLSAGAFVEYEYIHKRFLYRTRFRFTRGYFGNELFDFGKKTIDSQVFKLQSYLLYDIKANTELYRFFVGVNLIAKFEDNMVVNFDNNKINQIGLIEFAPSILVHRSLFFWRRNWILEGAFSIPILTYINSPQFTLPSFKGRRNEDVIFFAGNYFSLKTGLKFAYILANRNQLFIQYEWEYWGYSHLNKIQRAEHALALGINISL